MTVAPPLEVSTQVKLVFPSHRSLVAETGARGRHVPSPRVGAEQSSGSTCSHWARIGRSWAACPGHDAGRQGEERCADVGIVTDRSHGFLLLSHHSGWERPLGGLFPASPTLEFSGEARCLGQTWKRMKMAPRWGILEGGEPARRDRGVLVPRARR